MKLHAEELKLAQAYALFFFPHFERVARTTGEVSQ
jgi:hypothetical protein